MTYSPEDKENAVKLCINEGIAYASKKLKISKSTLKKWLADSENPEDKIVRLSLSLISRRIERSKNNEDMISSLLAKLESDAEITKEEKKQIIAKICSLYTVSTDELRSLEAAYRKKPESGDKDSETLRIELSEEVRKWAK